ncbi:MAG TPA: Smr/MutS family protein [Pyrinomonadaceae bacterium]|nr:Smr/MutS family protein [Pyrinomonadaceae bacterium]
MSKSLLRISGLIRRWLASGRRDKRAPDSRPGDEEADDVDAFDPFPEPVRLEIGDVFDLHSIPPREVRAVVEEYLSEARRLGLRQVRIIHGKGVGVQREIVRGVLARTPFVERFADAPPEAGGWGATVVRMKAEG